MLIRLSDALTAGKPLTIRKHAANGENSRDASLLGAFSVEETLTWTVTPSREYGVQNVVLRIAADGKAPRDFPFTWQEDGAFSLTLPLGVLCENIDNCLFYYHILLIRGDSTLFINPIDNVNFYISSNAEKSFRLLIHSADFTTPFWFRGGVMYHIFVDRFYRSGKVTENEKTPCTRRSGRAILPNTARTPAPMSRTMNFSAAIYGELLKSFPIYQSLV